jgi:4-hydroxybenzoate polyprenyltransferase
LLPGILNLRDVGWLKAFVIGFVWAGCANLAPIVMTYIEKGNVYPDPVLWVFLFVKNWMFCTVNAIIFDIKDYPTDANEHLKTFVVRFGLRRTIFFILIPLLSIGLFSLLCFTVYRGLSAPRIFINCLPFVLMLYVVYTMRKRHSLVYYLVLIDGALLFKAICGILAMAFPA